MTDRISGSVGSAVQTRNRPPLSNLDDSSKSTLYDHVTESQLVHSTNEHSPLEKRTGSADYDRQIADLELQKIELEIQWCKDRLSRGSSSDKDDSDDDAERRRQRYRSIQSLQGQADELASQIRDGEREVKYARQARERERKFQREMDDLERRYSDASYRPDSCPSTQFPQAGYGAQSSYGAASYGGEPPLRYPPTQPRYPPAQPGYPYYRSQPGYSQPYPGYDQPRSGYSQPRPGYQQSRPPASQGGFNSKPEVWEPEEAPEAPKKQGQITWPKEGQ